MNENLDPSKDNLNSDEIEIDKALRPLSFSDFNGQNQVIDNLSADELKRLQKFSYEYFITYTPAANGSTDTAKTKTASNSEGTDISEGTSYKQSGTKTATYYTIYSCGCNNSANNCNINSDSITRLEQDVTLTK